MYKDICTNIKGKEDNMIYQIMNYWDMIDRCKLYNNMILISQRKVNPNQVLYDNIRNELAKSYVKQIFNIRQEGKYVCNNIKTLFNK